MWQYNYSGEYLCHWGIKGMKWGVRRYQNPDGTLTPAGKKRYSDSDSSTESTSKSTSTKISDLSDDELRKLVNRKQTEKQLRDLLEAENRNPTNAQSLKKERSMVQQVLSDAGKQAFTTMAKGAMLYVGSTFVKEVLKNPDLAKAVATGSMGGSDKKDKS